MAGRITNFSFLGGYPRDFYMSYTQFWPIWLQTSEILGRFGAAAHEKASCSRVRTLPRGIWEPKDTPSPLTTAETPLRVLAGMAPTVTWGGHVQMSPCTVAKRPGAPIVRKVIPPEATPRGAENAWGPFLVPYGGT